MDFLSFERPGTKYGTVWVDSNKQKEVDWSDYTSKITKEKPNFLKPNLKMKPIPEMKEEEEFEERPSR